MAKIAILLITALLAFGVSALPRIEEDYVTIPTRTEENPKAPARPHVVGDYVTIPTSKHKVKGQNHLEEDAHGQGYVVLPAGNSDFSQSRAHGGYKDGFVNP